MLHHMLIESAARYPDRTAVVDGADSITYRELEEASSRLAGELAAQGASPGARVGLYLDKSLHAIVALWGVLRAGAAYVPLDAASPVKRVARIVENGDLCGVLSTPKRWPTLAPALALPPAFVGIARAPQRPGEIGFAFETPNASPVPAANRSGGSKEHDPSRAAYIPYTSGSTGQPKGVVLSHHAALSFHQSSNACRVAANSRRGAAHLCADHA